MNHKNYKNSPLNEVVFEIKLETASSDVIENLSEICKSLETDYPICKKKYLSEFSLNFENEIPLPSTETKQSLEGFFLSSKDEKSVLHLMRDGFAVSVLRPYTGWYHAFPSFLKYWNIYLNKITPRYINRIAVRSINVIPNVSSRDIQSYLSIGETDNLTGSRLLGFFDKRIFSLDNEAQFQAVITKTSNERNGDENLSDIILDIDVSNIVQREYDSASIESIFASIRSHKNQVFESIITDKSRSLFN
jgi:uncharacterized protein (TIGR04255 family)